MRTVDEILGCAVCLTLQTAKTPAGNNVGFETIPVDYILGIGKRFNEVLKFYGLTIVESE